MVPGRMALLVTLFLVLLNIFINITSKSPNTKSLTSISAWVIACIIFVYGALIEYGFILLYKYIVPQNYTMKKLKHIDIIFLMLSIILFIIFNFIFWSVS